MTSLMPQYPVSGADGGATYSQEASSNGASKPPPPDIASVSSQLLPPPEGAHASWTSTLSAEVGEGSVTSQSPAPRSGAEMEIAPTPVLRLDCSTHVLDVTPCEDMTSCSCLWRGCFFFPEEEVVRCLLELQPMAGRDSLLGGPSMQNVLSCVMFLLALCYFLLSLSGCDRLMPLSVV